MYITFRMWLMYGEQTRITLVNAFYSALTKGRVIVMKGGDWNERQKGAENQARYAYYAANKIGAERGREGGIVKEVTEQQHTVQQKVDKRGKERRALILKKKEEENNRRVGLHSVTVLFVGYKAEFKNPC